MRKSFLSLPVMLILSIISHLAAQDNKMTALFIINFAKYIDWDADQVKDDFIIAVLGDDPVQEQLKTLAADAEAGGKKIRIIMSASLDKIPACNILFITPDMSNNLGTAIAKFAPQRSLIVTKKEGLGRAGSCINIVSNEGKMGFEINPESLKRSQLVPKPALFKVGKVIGFFIAELFNNRLTSAL